MQRPWPNADGVHCLVLEPTEFLRRLAALVPAPYANLVRYHGVFAGRSRWRGRLPAPPGKRTEQVRATSSHTELVPTDSTPSPSPGVSTTPSDFSQSDSPSSNRRRRTPPWAQLLRRVFFLDTLTCPRCDNAMIVLALLSEPDVVRKILLHLKLPADVPTLAPAGLADDLLFDYPDDDTHTARHPH